MSKSVRGFHHFMGAYYSKSIVDAIESTGGTEPDYVMVGIYLSEVAADGEFRFVDDVRTGTLKLEVFSDGLAALLQFQDLIAAVAKRTRRQKMSIPDLCKLMVSMGIADLTEREPKAA